MHRLVILGLVASLLVSVSGCKKKSTSSGSSITLSATMGSGLNGSALFTPDDLVFALDRLGSILSARSTSTVNGVVAIPLYNGQMNVHAMAYAQTGSVVDGQMTISLQDSMDYIILLLDTTQARKIDQVVGYLNLSDASNGLMKIPTDSAATGSINVGTVTQASGSTSANSSTSLTELTSNFSVDLGVLQELAKTDDILQTGKNIYANYVSEAQYADTAPYFAFNGHTSDITGAYSDPTDAVYSGYGLYLDLAFPGVTMASVCAASGGKTLSLTPPSTITEGTDSFSGGTPDTYTVLDNTGVSGHSLRSGSEYQCGGSNALGAGSIYVHGVPTAESFGFNWGAGNGFANAIAAGEWVLKVDSTEVARFDLKAAAVLDSNSKPTVYVPVLKVDVDGSNIITAVSLKLYTWNGTAYAQVTDPTAFLAATSDFNLSITDYGQTGTETLYDWVDAGSGVFTITNFGSKSWKLGNYGTGNTTHYAATSIVASYKLYGASMRFDFRSN